MSSILSFSCSTKSSELESWRFQDGIPYLPTADGEDANAERSSCIRRRFKHLLVPTPESPKHHATASGTPPGFRSDTGRRFSTSTIDSVPLLWYAHGGLDTEVAITPLSNANHFKPVTDLKLPRRRTQSLDGAARAGESMWARTPSASAAAIERPESTQTELQEKEQESDETGPTEPTQSMLMRTRSTRQLPLRRTFSSGSLPVKALHAKLLDFDSVKSFHNFYTKPATLRDKHLFWNAFWRAIFFPLCRSWWVSSVMKQVVTPVQFRRLSLLYVSHLLLLILYFADLLPAAHFSENCFWDLMRPCFTLVIVALMHADVVAVAIPLSAFAHPSAARRSKSGLQMRLGPEEELCSADSSDSTSDCDESLHLQSELQQEVDSLRSEVSVNTHCWTDNGRHYKETFTLQQFRSLLTRKVNKIQLSPFIVTATRFFRILVFLVQWIFVLGDLYSSFAAAPAITRALLFGSLTKVLISLVSTGCMVGLTGHLFKHLVEADLTFSRRLMYARYFKSVTSSGKARRYGIPHFSLKNGANIRFWLALRAGRPWLAQHAEQRAADVVVTQCFVMTCILLFFCFVLSSGKGDFPTSQADWEIVEYSAGLSILLLRFLVLGSRINAKYSDTTVLLTEQINLQLRMLVADSPEKLDRLKVTSNVLKVATKLLHELGKPSKVSGIAINKNFCNFMRVVVLSALSAALSYPLGFKIRLTTLAKMK